MPKRSHIAVKLARNATPKDLLGKLASSLNVAVDKNRSITISHGEKPAQLEIYNVKNLPKELQSSVWNLYVQNMQTLLEESMSGWSPTEKLQELFHTESRFLVIRSPTQDQPLGFSIFRFDTEETAEDEDADVVYCYEVHVDPKVHGTGTGMLLMDCLERIGKETKMDKTMLTVLKANKSAVAFYRKVGFTVDEIDPSNYEDAEVVDYQILSKSY